MHPSTNRNPARSVESRFYCGIHRRDGVWIARRNSHVIATAPTLRELAARLQIRHDVERSLPFLERLRLGEQGISELVEARR